MYNEHQKCRKSKICEPEHSWTWWYDRCRISFNYINVSENYNYYAMTYTNSNKFQLFMNPSRAPLYLFSLWNQVNCNFIKSGVLFFVERIQWLFAQIRLFKCPACRNQTQAWCWKEGFGFISFIFVITNSENVQKPFGPLYVENLILGFFPKFIHKTWRKVIS